MKAKKLFSLLLAVLTVCCVSSNAFAAPQINLNLEISERIFPDSAFRAYIANNFDTDSDGQLSLQERLAVTDITLYDEGATNLDGVQYFINLQRLTVSRNKLTSLNLESNTNLEMLLCNENELAELDISKNIKLTMLDCGDNRLTELELSANTALGALGCYENQLSTLDVSMLAELSLLNCSTNSIEALDVSKNTKLAYLDAGSNKLSSINLSANTALEYLYLESNALTVLDVSENTALVVINASNNNLYMLEADNHAKLTELECAGNICVVTVGEDRKLDFNKMPVPPSGTRVSNLVGGVVDRFGVLTVNADTNIVSYTYKINDSYSAEFKLLVVEQSYAYGDVNGDGNINAADASLVLQYNVQLAELNEGQQKAAELNADGKISAADASLILQYNVQLIKKFPVEG